MLRAWFTGVISGLPAFAVAAASVGLAIVWLKVSELAAVVVVLVGAAGGGFAYWRGTSALSAQRPRPMAAVRWLNGSILVPAAVGTAAATALILLAVKYAPKTSWSTETKGLVATGTAAVATYLTTAFVTGVDQADAGIGATVKRAFQKAFKGRFAAGSEARDAVFSEVRFSGWGRDVRTKRAAAIDRELSGTAVGSAETAVTDQGSPRDIASYANFADLLVHAKREIEGLPAADAAVKEEAMIVIGQLDGAPAAVSHQVLTGKGGAKLADVLARLLGLASG